MRASEDFFFTAPDPDGLQRWYAEQLGVVPPPATYEEPVWEQQTGPTVFAAFDDADSPTWAGPDGASTSEPGASGP